MRGGACDDVSAQVFSLGGIAALLLRCSILNANVTTCSLAPYPSCCRTAAAAAAVAALVALESARVSSCAAVVDAVADDVVSASVGSVVAPDERLRAARAQEPNPRRPPAAAPERRVARGAFAATADDRVAAAAARWKRGGWGQQCRRVCWHPERLAQSRTNLLLHG